MSKKDELKELLGFYKTLITAFLTALFSVLSYAFINNETLSNKEILILSISAPMLLIFIVIFVILFLKTNKKLGKEN